MWYIENLCRTLQLQFKILKKILAKYEFFYIKLFFSPFTLLTNYLKDFLSKQIWKYLQSPILTKNLNQDTSSNGETEHWAEKDQYPINWRFSKATKTLFSEGTLWTLFSITRFLRLWPSFWEIRRFPTNIFMPLLEESNPSLKPQNLGNENAL